MTRLDVQELTTTLFCKVPGCTNEAPTGRGRFAHLCEKHRGTHVVSGEKISLDAAISQLIELGEKDPIEIARKLEKRHGIDWLTRELSAHAEEIVSEIARQHLGRRRRAASLPSVIESSGTTRETMLSPIFIPGVGWKSLGDCTTDDLAAREQFYLKAAGAMVRWASWCRECIEEMRVQGVSKLSQLKGQLPELPAAEAV